MITLSKKKVMASHCTNDGENMEQRLLSPVPAVGEQDFKDTYTHTHISTIGSQKTSSQWGLRNH